ncbi:hypothetical protein CH373_11085 [Leptospira perolatii]|uniref:Uncharacterized protein n=1 Tax=Leptospira perolatii TaxID=2023191 RepID=A0A2M9ZLR9_9LEPT|nr:hypothetical protein [Leptospira perolatii]PJZ69749.1 hypothetical protein CH360_09150 [Leptospira perolatii]PJZ73036.1 hypothetical protein CH373_11085 [Leptospira perolatii]
MNRLVLLLFLLGPLLVGASFVKWIRTKKDPTKNTLLGMLGLILTALSYSAGFELMEEVPIFLAVMLLVPGLAIFASIAMYFQEELARGLKEHEFRFKEIAFMIVSGIVLTLFVYSLAFILKRETERIESYSMAALSGTICALLTILAFRHFKKLETSSSRFLFKAKVSLVILFALEIGIVLLLVV